MLLLSLLILQTDITNFPVCIPHLVFWSGSHYYLLGYCSNLLIVGLPPVFPSLLAVESLGMIIPLKLLMNMPSTVPTAMSQHQRVPFLHETYLDVKNIPCLYTPIEGDHPSLNFQST